MAAGSDCAGDALLAARQRIRELEGRLRASAASRQVLQGEVAGLEHQQAKSVAMLGQERTAQGVLQDQLTCLSAEHAEGQACAFLPAWLLFSDAVLCDSSCKLEVGLHPAMSMSA